MDSSFSWAYEHTLREAFDWYVLTWFPEERRPTNVLERRPFVGIEKKPLRDGLMYQAALCGTPIFSSVWDLMIRSGVGPAVNTHDKRTGVIILKDDKVVGGNVDPGLSNPPKYSFYVDPDYRGMGVGKAAIVAMWKEFPRHATMGTRSVLNQYGAYAILSAFPEYLELCKSAGLPIPQRVWDSLEADKKIVLANIESVKSKAASRL